MEQREVKKRGEEEEEEDSGSDRGVSPQVCYPPNALAYILFSRVDTFSLTVQRSIHSSHRLSATGITMSFVQSPSSTRLIRPPANFL